MQADTIIRGGRIFCGLVEGFTEAIAIKGDRILATGTNADIAALQGPETKLIELAGRAAIPAFNDAHMHIMNLGVSMVDTKLRPEDGIRSVEAMLAEVKFEAGRRKPGQWITGRGYNHADFTDEQRHPTAAELDAAAPHNPVYLKRTCGHLAVANSLAFAAAGIDASTPDPDGGIIERRDGQLTGLLAERAMLLLGAVVPKPTKDELIAAIERAGRFMHTQGFTSVMDAAVGQTGFAEAEAYEEAAATGRLPLRTWVCLYGDPAGIADAAYARNLTAGRKVGRLRYGAMKIFADGSAGSLTAAMSMPYVYGEPNNTGILIFRDDDMQQMVSRYHQQGYQLAIHAIGDAAIEQVLSSIEHADSPEHPIKGRRHRIEHCGFVNADQLARMQRAGIYPVPQSILPYTFGDLYIQNLGEERSHASYPYRTWMDQGFLPSASSDGPVCTTDPFKNLYSMVTRRTKKGTLLGEDQRLTIEEAVHAYTYCSAFTQFAENDRGRLLPGQLADIAILSEDIFVAPPERLEFDIRCDLTLMDGQVVYDRAGQAV